jgi:hypothetical protein
VLVQDSWIFIPSATPDRVWVGVVDPKTIGSSRGLAAIREVAVDGQVTVPDTKPPGGRWPVATTKTALAFQVSGGLEVWDPVTGKVLRQLSGVFPVATYGGPPPGTYRFDPYEGAFSPDGRSIAVPVGTDPKAASQKWQLALVDIGAGTAMGVKGTSVHGYVWSLWPAAV